MPKYKFRAECISDVYAFAEAATITKLDIRTDPHIPDVEVYISSDLSLSQLREIASEVPDGHVMVQSINTKKLYTGERYYQS